MLKEACPLASSVRMLKGAGPNIVSNRSTVPVGVPLVPVTAIVKFTCCPRLTGFGEVLSVVMLGVEPVTLCVSEFDWLALLLASPG